MRVEESSLTQIIHPHSSASFQMQGMRPPYQIIKCKGDTVSLSVAVQGSGPWDVTYEISHTTTKRMVRRVEEQSKGFSILVDGLDAAGIYSIDLVGMNNAHFRDR